ncbi:MAG: LLM class F420-dependent oxidoreductase [Candidatus Dormibacteraeota bacterium]|nr:LLM class F420-dependent oxidoreductase [Candidatus Dormibacteraeota bacterium]
MAIKFGIFVPQGWRMDLAQIKDPVGKYEAMTRVAQAADKGRWDSIWVYDHFHTMPEPKLEATFECWTITSTLVRDTKRVRVGQMVGCNGYRHPALYAKIASTVDVASHGRLNAGIGAGWYEHEWRAYGYGFPELRERMGMFKEACEIIHKMWSEDYPTFKGKYYSIDRPINEPKGVQKPHIPLWIGGSGERVTLKLVAQFGDACNIGGDPETIRHKLGVLREHCDATGRNYDDIIKSSEANVLVIGKGEDPERVTARARVDESFREGTLVADADQVAAHLERMIEAGIDYFIVYIPGVAYDQEPLQRFESEVIPRLAASTPVHSASR